MLQAKLTPQDRRVAAPQLPQPNWNLFLKFAPVQNHPMLRHFPFICLLALLMLGLQVRATNSDSLDVLHYGIHIDTISNSTTVKTMRAHTDVRLVSTVASLSSITLDLLRFQVDSIRVNGVNTAFSYNDTLLAIHPSPAPALGDTVDVTVWYQGRSPLDAGGFGGVYYVTNNVFNLGVGLTTDPHVYGRSWFPCKDNFVDRAYFDFYMRIDNSLFAVCNGTLVSTTSSGGASKTQHWRLRDNIPTYLASFAVAPYAHVARTFVSTSGDTLPYDIYALAADTASAKTQAQRLLTGVAAFESRFGAFSWERLGYVIVNQPTNGSVGAMEHATNIAYPRVLLNQGQAYETIWAHEASHHWFGDLVTCEEEGEMWLNEGWASYCESIFEEAAYGFATYKNYNRSTHSEVLRRAYIEDGGYQPLSAMPHAYTYGRTTYSRGALVAHSLRGQLGDAAFFPAMTQYLDDYRFSHVNSDSMRLSLEATTGRNLQNFFDSWVHQGGFLHVSLDSFYTALGGLDHTYMFFRQRLKGGASVYADSLVVPIRLLGANWERYDMNVVLTGPTDSIHIGHGGLFETVAVIIDPEEWIADATTDNYKTLRTVGAYSFANTWLDVVVDSIVDSAWVQVTHNWVAPDSFRTPRPGIKLSNSRYWSVRGIFPSGFHAQGKFFYNGTTSLSAGLLDNTWMTNGEDSLILFYRPSARADWQEVTGIVRNIGSPNDKSGNIVALDLLAGEYALGTYDNFTATEEPQPLGVKVYPNPNDGRFTLELPMPVGKYEVRMCDGEGRLLYEATVENQATIALEKAYLASGWYLVTVRDEAGRVGSQRVLIER
jgi:Peptidase family M1 domain/Peptidase M1 N-terminal domain/Secretion system C-terminal sorting domain